MKLRPPQIIGINAEPKVRHSEPSIELRQVTADNPVNIEACADIPNPSIEQITVDNGNSQTFLPLGIDPSIMSWTPLL